MTIDEAIRLVRNIKWISIDRDNMEFRATVSCYQIDAINLLLLAATAAHVLEDDGQPDEQQEWHDYDPDC